MIIEKFGEIVKRFALVVIVFLDLLLTTYLFAQENSLDGAILVVNKTRSSVSIIFTDPAKETINIPTGEGPSEIVISPDRKLAVVSNYGFLDEGSSLTFIDLEKYSLIKNLEFEGYVRPNGMVFLPKSQDPISTQIQSTQSTQDPISAQLLVTFEARRSIAIIDVDSSRIIKEIRTNQEKPRQIAIHPTGKAAYVTNEISGTVSVLDLNDFTLVGNVEIGAGIEGIDVSRNGKEVWVANKLDNKIYIIETNDHKVIESFKSPVFPSRLKFTPNGKNVLVLNTRSGHITYIDVKTRRDVLYSSSDDFSEIIDTEFKLYGSFSNYTVINRTKGALSKRMKQLSSGELSAPVSLGISPNGDYAFIANSIKKSVSVMYLNGQDKFTLAGNFPLINTPGGVAFLPAEVNDVKYNANSNFDKYWLENRPMIKYFKELTDAADENFVKDFEVPFKFVLSRDGMKKYEALEDVSAKKKYITDYINSKDENPLYPVNYWFIEFIGRVSYAKENYSLRKKPYFDDRGKFYIQFGRPIQKHTDPGGPHKQEFLEKQFSSTADWQIKSKMPNPIYNTLPNEIWSYYYKNVSFTVYFAEEGYYKERKNGLAGILESTRIVDVVWYWMDLVKERSFVSSEVNFAVNLVEKWEVEYEGIFDFTDIEINRDNIPGFLMPHAIETAALERAKVIRAIPIVSTRFEEVNLIDFDLESAQFKARNKETRIKFVTYADPNDIRLFAPGAEEKQLNLGMEYLFRDSTLSEIYRDKTTDSFGNYEKLKSIFLTTETTLLPIDGDLTIQLQNTDTKELGFKKYPISVRDFSGGELMLSDILYYTPIQLVEFENSYTPEKIKGSEVIPYPYPHVVRELPVMCYFEVYNLVRGREGTMYEVEMKLTKDTSGENVLQKLGGVFSGRGEEVRSMKYQITEYENDSKQLIGFDLNKVGKGKYDLEITITSLFDSKITASNLKKMVIK